MVNNIKTIVDLVVKRIDLVTKFISILFIMALFTNYLHDYYYVNILDLLPLLPEAIQLLLQKFEFFLYWILPFLYGILGIFFCFWIVSGVNVNIRMYNFDDVQCTVIPSVAYGFVTGMNLQLY